MGLWVVPFVLVVLAVVGLLYFNIRHRSNHDLSSIPLAPKGSKVPIIGYVIDLLSLKSSPWELFAEWVRTQGTLMRFHFFNANMLVVAEPDLIKHMFQTKVEIYHKDVTLSYATFMPLLGRGLVTSHGEHWAYQRKLLGAVFKIEILQDTMGASMSAVNRLSAKIYENIAKSNGKAEIEISEEFRSLTLQVIGQAVLNMPPQESDKVFPSLYPRRSEMMNEKCEREDLIYGRYLPIVDFANEKLWYPWKGYIPSSGGIKAFWAIRNLNKFFCNKIVERIRSFNPANPSNEDILDRIISGLHSSGKLHEKWVVPQICDEIKTFILAGHETSSMMLTWALYELSRHPECLQKVLDEANKVFPPSLPEGQLPTYDSLSDLSYTHNVLKEALRKYYIVPVVNRITVEDDMLGGHFIPKGTRICIPIIAVNYHKDFWTDPEQFIPERFENPDMHPYQFLGFIGGARRCLGQNFALLETKIVLAKLVQRFNFGGHPSGKIHPFNVPVCPNEGMFFEISKRTK